MSTRKKLLIYTRLSSGTQPPESHEAQERKVRDALTKMGPDRSEAVVIHEEAQSGTEAVPRREDSAS